MEWKTTQIESFSIEQEKLGEGGFRVAYKATSSYSPFVGKNIVVKKYLKKTLDALEVIQVTASEHAKKRAYAYAFANKVTNEMTEDFGETFSYGKAYYGTIVTT